MNLGRVNNLYGMYSTLFQGNMSVYSHKLTKMLKPVNKAQTVGILKSGSFGYVKSLKTGASALSQALSDLSAGKTWNKNIVSSSDNDVLSADISGDTYSVLDRSYSISVKQTASGQVNLGTQLKSDSLYGRIGTSEFSIEVGGSITNLSVAITDRDTNNDVLQKIAGAINNANTGVKASVVSDNLQNTSALKLQSTGIGDADMNRFRLTDITKSLVSITGANRVTQDAQNAVFSIDGGELQSSNTNTIDLGHGLTITLKKPSDKNVTVSAVIDNNYIGDLVQNMVTSFNNLFDTAIQNSSNDPKAMKLFSKMVNAGRTFSRSLDNIGIGFDESGYMLIDNEKFDKAAENGKLEKFFTESTNRNFGFPNLLAKISSSVTNNTSNYISSYITGSYLTENFAYNNSGKLLQYSYMNSGLLLDYTF